MRADQRLEFAAQLCVTSEREIGLDPVFESRQSQLLEPRDLILRELVIGEIRERRSPPERKAVAEQPGRARHLTPGEHLARLRASALEALRVELSRLEPEDVPGSNRLEGLTRLRPKPLTHLGDACLQRVGRLARRLGAPHRFDQPVARDDLVRVEEEIGEDDAGLVPGQAERAPSDAHVERSEDSILQLRRAR